MSVTELSVLALGATAFAAWLISVGARLYIHPRSKVDPRLFYD